MGAMREEYISIAFSAHAIPVWFQSHCSLFYIKNQIDFSSKSVGGGRFIQSKQTIGEKEWSGKNPLLLRKNPNCLSSSDVNQKNAIVAVIQQPSSAGVHLGAKLHYCPQQKYRPDACRRTSM